MLGPYTLVTSPRGTPARASSPSPLTSILEKTVSVNSSALMVESLQGLMARMACREEEVRGPSYLSPRLRGGGAAWGVEAELKLKSYSVSWDTGGN